MTVQVELSSDSVSSWQASATKADTMLSLLEARAATTPDAVYMEIEDAGPLTYREVRERTHTLASALARLGVERGSTVATLMGTHADGVILFFAAGLLGAVFMPINTALRGTFLAHQLRMSETMVLMTEHEREDDVAAVAPSVSEHLRVVVVVDAELETSLGGVPALPIGALLEQGGPEVLPSTAGTWNDPAMILFTSGTTGPSKGVVLSHNYLIFMADLYRRSLKVEPSDCFYACLPLFHLSGGVVTSILPLVSGARSVLDRTFSVSNFWRRIRECGATHSLILAAMPEMLSAART